MKQRLDLLMAERGLAPSRQTAQALIMSGRVNVNGRRHDKPGARVDTDAEVTVNAPEAAYVGRGGVKLAGALDAFAIEVSGLTAVDIGASTGGFTDCLLQRGARQVFAVDVGRGQIDWKLRNDARVVLIESLNARYIRPEDLPGLGAGADLVTIDVSFISLTLILPRAPALLRKPPSPGSIVALVKPQFEVGRGRVGRGGVVRDPDHRHEALSGVAAFCLDAGLSVLGLARSSITGMEGNVEYFVHLSTTPGGLTAAQIEEQTARLCHGEPEHG
jgi:23S rRNA (cytidine1920-2'-O)/16S rRNA (cytidine1409-2'-O)-methyltransferase